MKQIKKLKNLWKLSKKSDSFSSFLESVNDEDLASIPEESTKAVFMNYGTDEEYEEWVKEQNGWASVHRRLLSLIKKNNE